jgi:hypothetical protein
MGGAFFYFEEADGNWSTRYYATQHNFDQLSTGYWWIYTSPKLKGNVYNGDEYTHKWRFAGWSKSNTGANGPSLLSTVEQCNPEQPQLTYNQEYDTGTQHQVWWYGNESWHYYFKISSKTGVSYTMNYNGGTNSTGSVNNTTITYNATGTIATNANPGFALTGHTFSSWNVYYTGTYIGNYGNGASLGTWGRTGNHSATAQWTANTFTIAHNPNAINPAATGSTGNTTSTYNNKAKANTNGFSRTGYFFAGWILTADGTGTDRTVYQANSEFTHPSTVSTLNLYATWTGWLYTLSYDGNTGTSTTTATTSRYPDKVIVASNSFTKTGYYFKGWAIKTNDIIGDVVYQANNEIDHPGGTDNSATTLYAKWGANTYTITYTGNGNNGAGTTTASSPVYDADFTFKANSFVRTGYTFNQWKLMNGETEVGNYAASVAYGKWDIASDCTAVAQWTINTYLITFDNNGKGIGKSVTQDYNSTVTCPPLKAVGYVFGGWATSVHNATNKIVEKAGNATFILSTSDVNLYAIWTDNANNTVRFSELQTVFGGSNPISISEYRTQSGQTTANSRITVSTHFKGKGVAPP